MIVANVPMKVLIERLLCVTCLLKGTGFFISDSSSCIVVWKCSYSFTYQMFLLGIFLGTYSHYFTCKNLNMFFVR